MQSCARVDLGLGPLEFLATTPRQLFAYFARRRARDRETRLNFAMIAATLATVHTGRPVLPEEFLGEAASARRGPAPGSREETAGFLAAMGAQKASS